ncbi:MAG: hypothetical protein Q9191_005206 [Dirinaria sp. TL-2023a]
MASNDASKASAAIQYAKHSEKLSLLPHDAQTEDADSTSALQAKFITPQDPVIETSNGGRLPAIPLAEAVKLNELKEQVEGPGATEETLVRLDPKDGEEVVSIDGQRSQPSERAEAPLRTAVPSSRTNPLFPELPLYGPPTLMRDIQCIAFRISSSILSLAFLAVIVLGSAFTSIPLMFKHIAIRLTFKDPDARRPFYEEEKKRQRLRKEQNDEWGRRKRRGRAPYNVEAHGQAQHYEPMEGGKDPLVCDVGYYARRVGLDTEEFKVQTEDGFIIKLLHLYDPAAYTPTPNQERDCKSPKVFTNHDAESGSSSSTKGRFRGGQRRYPVLLMPGLLQSAGAYCSNDDESLAFFLCKSGYDVWLGNNRCGFTPEHQLLTYGDPRMWAWNIRQMGVMDLPAHISRVLLETGFSKLGLICHSQGTTQTFVALAKEQRPDLGNKVSVFCALAPAVYAGSLIGKMYFKFMRIISPGMFRMMFGIHAFIPFMMTMHSYLPGKLYGALGYRVFSFLFDWTDDRWDQGLRDRMFQFSPIYVSSECMRWWLGRECFAKQRCILATRIENEHEDLEDEEEDSHTCNGIHPAGVNGEPETRGSKAWYDEQVPPFAIWVAGSDKLVDGRRLLRRFERGREPHVKVVHSKIIEEYEHLDVIWAIDSIEQIGKEAREVLWRTAPREAKDVCRIPKGCENIQA